ncbi:LysR family transcriptional regulator [Inquilinus limosus]|uniref:Transcriptional regulator n=1 Tax=Inquilinus limosus MP06 TaxID=1398085 RepID=A0A0A0D2J3_9PROT|nr:LysR family transcriptional regulator [Inquilinus limosus]KGM32274.1 transcriptional regulator [Inquilinus limosus MP06]
MDRLAAMEAFIRVVDAGSFSGAARQMRVGQPAISKIIAQLEARLGVRLLLRSTRGLTPTEAGRSFYERAKRSLQEVEEAEHAARGAAAALSGRLRVGAPVTFTRLMVVPRLGAFLAAHPALDIDIVLDDRPIDLIEEGIDVALRMGQLPDSGLAARKIGECRRLVLGTPGYVAAQGVPRVPVDLLSHQVVIHEPRGGSSGAAWTFRRGDAQVPLVVGGRLRISAAEGVRESVLAGLGLAIASEWMFGAELASGAVVSVLEDWQLPPVGLWAVFPTGRQASAKARAFADFVERQVAGAIL